LTLLAAGIPATFVIVAAAKVFILRRQPVT
jgi:hypothetical protein